jgi:hypothetical protein
VLTTLSIKSERKKTTVTVLKNPFFMSHFQQKNRSATATMLINKRLFVALSTECGQRETELRNRKL